MTDPGRAFRTAAVLPTMVLGLTAAAQGQDTYRDYLLRQMSAIDRTVAGSGYRPDAGAIAPDEYAEPVIGLKSASGVGLELVLQAEQRYRVYTDDFGLEWDDCAKSVEDRLGNTLFFGTWSKDRLDNVLDFTSPAGGTHILVFNCPEGVTQFYYGVERLSPTGSFVSVADVFPSDMVVGFLRSGGAVQLDLELDPEVEYLIAGVCDQDCSDLDLALTDGDNAILLTDELDDDAPVLQFTSQPDGSGTLWVTMYACSIEPCSFAYRVYRR